MPERNRFHGIVPPMLTPLNSDEEVDRASTARLVNYMIENGVHGLWLLGTTGEFAALRAKERDSLLNAAVEANHGRVPLIANISGGSTQLAIQNGLRIRNMAVDAVAATPPYYYVHTQKEIADHYRAIHSAIGLPLFIYNIPQTCKLNVEPATSFQLAKEGVVAGIKDSSIGNVNQCRLLARSCEDEGVPMRVFLGTQVVLDTGYYMGFHGAIPSIANAAPSICAEAYNASVRGDMAKAAEFQQKVITIGTKITGIPQLKVAAKLLGIIESDVCVKPFAPVPDADRERIKKALDEAGIAISA